VRNKDFRSLNSQSQEELRKRVVKAVSDGMTRQDAGKFFGVTRQSVGQWVKAHDKGGEKALQAQKRGRPVGRQSLTGRQAQAVQKTIIDHTPDQIKLPFCLWTREAVGLLIKKRFGTNLSVWTVGRFLNEWGFTPQKPVRRAFEQDPEAVSQWLKKEYPQIRRRAKAEGAEIYWGDEMGLRSDHATGRSFSPQGQTPIVPGTGQRFGCNMISAITNRGKLNFMIFNDRFNAGMFINFLKRLQRQVKRKIFLIVERHPAHRSVKLMKWIKTNKNHIRLFYLPGYAPELNPDEELNQDVKSNAVGRQRAHNADELMRNVRGYLRGRQKRPDIVKNYFQEEHVKYASV